MTLNLTSRGVLWYNRAMPRMSANRKRIVTSTAKKVHNLVKRTRKSSAGSSMKRYRRK